MRSCRLEPARRCGGLAPEWAFCFAKYSPTSPLRTPLDSIEQVFPTGFDNQQIKFEQSKRLSGETPLNASLYKKGATIVAPRYHSSRTKFGRQGLRLCVQAPACRQGLRLCYSHSIVAGGLEEMSKQTRLTPLTSLMIRLEILARTSCGMCAQSAVIAS